MPNTAVKLLRAESSSGIAHCEDRTLPRVYSGLAQLAERLTVNQSVASSSLASGVHLESCPSGLWSTIGNDVNGQYLFRGFESLTLRYDPLVKWFKTLPFHGSNTGPNPVRVIMNIMVRWSTWFRTLACHARDHRFESGTNR